MDIDALYGDLDAATQAELDALLGFVSFDSIPIDVWVDDNGIARRIGMDISFGADFGADFGVPGDFSAGVAMTMDLFDFNGPVSITLPNPADVADFGTLFDDLFYGDYGTEFTY